MSTSEDTATVPSKDTPADPLLVAKIIKQVEFYFGDKNLPRDKFLLRILHEEGMYHHTKTYKTQRMVGFDLFSSQTEGKIFKFCLFKVLVHSTTKIISEQNLFRIH